MHILNMKSIELIFMENPLIDELYQTSDGKTFFSREESEIVAQLLGDNYIQEHQREEFSDFHSHEEI